MSGRTDHAVKVAALRRRAEVLESLSQSDPSAHVAAVAHRLAADLLEAHDDTGISLDNWPAATEFVSLHLRFLGLGLEIAPNGA